MLHNKDVEVKVIIPGKINSEYKVPKNLNEALSLILSNISNDIDIAILERSIVLINGRNIDVLDRKYILQSGDVICFVQQIPGG